MAKRPAKRSKASGKPDLDDDPAALLAALQSGDPAAQLQAARRLSGSTEEWAELRVAAVLLAASAESAEELYLEVKSSLLARPERWRVVEPALIEAALDREATLERRAFCFGFLASLRHEDTARSGALAQEAAHVVRTGPEDLAGYALAALGRSTDAALVALAVELINEEPRRLVLLPDPSRVLRDWTPEQVGRIDLRVWRATLATLRDAGQMHIGAWKALCCAGPALLHLEPELRELPGWAEPQALLQQVERLRAPASGPQDAAKGLLAFFKRPNT